MSAAYFEDHPTDPDKMIMRKPSMKVEGPFHVVCQCDKCKAQPERTWVGLTHAEIDYQAKKDDHGVYFALGALWAEAKLKEKNT